MERQAILQKRKAHRLDDKLIKCKGVLGIDVEHKREKGQKTDKVGITVYVMKKLPHQKLSAIEAIPPTINGIPTDVVEVVNLWGLWNPSQRSSAQAMQSQQRATLQGTDVLVGGLSIRNEGLAGGGTLGIVLSSKGVPTALSCAHVMVNPNTSPRVGQTVIEPKNGKVPDDKMGAVSLYSINDAKVNVDAALVPIISGRKSTEWTVNGIGAIGGWGSASVGDDVEKVGQSSGHTYGKIVSTDFTATLQDQNWGSVKLENLIKIDSKFSVGGDSGSALISSKTKKMVGMVEGGGDTSSGSISVSQQSSYLQAWIPN